MEQPNEIKFNVWWKNGIHSIRRDALPADHPENEYNHIKNTFRVDPEDYGILNPIMGKYKDMDNKQLLIEISRLESEIRNCYNYR